MKRNARLTAGVSFWPPAKPRRYRSTLRAATSRGVGRGGRSSNVDDQVPGRTPHAGEYANFVAVCFTQPERGEIRREVACDGCLGSAQRAALDEEKCLRPYDRTVC